MNRKEFMNVCAYACLGGAALTTILSSCSLSKTISGNIIESDIVVDLKEFEIQKKGSTTFRKYLIIQNDQLKFPISVYRLSETEYSALYLQCTHQGAELQVFGEKLHCPAHGSEFSNRGVVEQGPAENNLRSFPVRIESRNLKISLV
ncbi:MAG: Rieske 2Fe-2S domain-containing protein [Crocinitomicaceae bacterium]|nr:Rieske 2Fe-2S domain-containing protein [Crocinitomicaceae bacterium]MCF8409894.1 Rieske 2Fe-2S domain-containing protein [Crocinitomicaceae bacterium]